MIASLTSVDALREYVADGDTIGVGGAGLVRKPMALLRALVAASIRDLRVVSFLGSVDVEYLIAAGVVNQLHSAGVSLDGFGLAPAFRAARQGGTIEFVEWSEGSLTAAVEASARGLPSLACSTAPASDVVVHNAWLGTYPDPPTEVPTVFATALDIDVALIHAAGSDADSNIYVEGDLALDGLLARAATTSLVSYEAGSEADPATAAISRLWVDAVVEAPGGSWPTECYPAALVDLGAVAGWAGSDGERKGMLEPRP